MRAIVGFVKTVLIGGVLFLLPFVLVLILLRRAIEFVRPAVEPLAERFPDHTIPGVAAATVFASALVVLICFVAGMVARTAAGRRVSVSLEHKFLNRTPIYRMLKGMLQGFAAVESTVDVSPALARIDDAWQLGFILEEHDNGLRTVFVPQSPNPLSGSVFYLPENRVQRLSVPIGQVYQCIAHMGVGSKNLLQGRV